MTDELQQLHSALLARLATGERAACGADPDRLQVAQHEAAHVVATLFTRGGVVHSVAIHPPGRVTRSGIFAETASTCRLPADEALAHLVGYAWEELHGHPDRASGDLMQGYRFALEAAGFAAEDGDPPPDILASARAFVVERRPLILETGAIFLAGMPKTGVLKGRTLGKIIDEIRIRLAEQDRALHLLRRR